MKPAWPRRIAERLDDALNPIVVKELRQAVHGRFLTGILLFFLALQLGTLGIFMLSKGIDSIDLVSGESYGEEVFGALTAILFFATVLCIPVYAAVRLVGEQSSDAMGLFFVSTLEPQRIVAGKLGSNLVLALLLFSACLPYLSFTYFLRGIDLPTVAVALSVGLLASAAGIQLAIFLASLAAARVLRILIGLAGLGWLTMLYFTSLTFSAALPQLGIGSRLGSWDFWTPALVVVFGVGLLYGLVFWLSVALITHAAANRARPVRLYASAAWLAAALGVGYACFFHGEKDLVVAWLSLAMPLLAASFLPAVCARDRMSQRVAGEVPRSPGRRIAAFFVFSGSANGIAFSALLIALTYALGEVFNQKLGGALGTLPRQLFGLCAYLCGYALLAVTLQRRLLGRSVRREQTWVLALGLIAFGSAVVPIAGMLVAPDTVGRTLDFGLWLILNPFSPFRDQLEELAIRFSLGWAAVTAVLAGEWFLTQVRAFRPQA